VPTALELIGDALSELGVLAAGETVSASDGQLGLRKLNALIDQWKTKRLMIYTVTQTTKTLSSGTQAYTVGSGGDVNIDRPLFLDRVTYKDTSLSTPSEIPLELLEAQGWQNIVIKSQAAVFPSKVYYNPTFPLGTLSFWPVQSSATVQANIYHPAAVGELAATSTSVSVPPGYRRMIVKNLAVDLAPSFGRQAPAELVRAAAGSMDSVQARNFPVLELHHEFQGGHGNYDIDTDE